MEQALGPEPAPHSFATVDLYDRRLRDARSDAAVLARLFLIGRTVALADAARVVQPVILDTLVRAGLAVVGPDSVRPLVRMTFVHGLVIVSDPIEEWQRRDYVTGPSPAAAHLERLTIRRPVTTALDLGTGPGVLALVAARHSAHVIGVDINVRALAFARFNAALNDISNVEFRAGNWFEPVARERFDLIVANPPYVISPDATMLYRDGGVPADSLTLELLRNVSAHLEEGGFAHVAGNWIHRPDEDWRGPLEASLAGAECDALLLKYATFDPLSYAAQWNSELVADGLPEFLSAVDRWLDYYQRHGIESISDGVIVLRRRAGVSWVRAIEVPGRPEPHAGDHVLRLFHARDRRDGLADDATLLSTAFARAPGFKMVWRANGGSLENQSLRLELQRSVGFSVPVPPDLADLIRGLDGIRPLAGFSITADSLPEIRRLFALGLIVIGNGRQSDARLDPGMEQQ